jgi:WD40 repeat protein
MRRARLAALAFALAFVFEGCGLDDNEALFARQREAQERAEAIIDLLAFEGGAISEEAKEKLDGGPEIFAIEVPLRLSESIDFDLGLHLDPGTETPATVRVMVPNAWRRWIIDVDPEGASKLVIPASIVGDVDRDVVAAIDVAAVAADGRAGRSVRFNARISEAGPQAPIATVFLVQPAPFTSALAFAKRDGRQLLAAGDAQGAITLWDAGARTRTATMLGHTAAVTSMSWTADGRRIYSASRDHTVRLWSAADGALLATYGEHLDEVRSVAVVADDKVVSGGWDGRLLVRDTATGKLVADIDAGAPVSQVVWAPAGDALLATTGRTLTSGRMMWSALSGERTFEDLPEAATAAAYSSDGSRFAVAYGRGSIRVWSARPLEAIAELNPPCASATEECQRQVASLGVNGFDAPRDFITVLSFLPGRPDLLLAGSLDGSIALWNVDAGRIVGGVDSDLLPTSMALSEAGDLIAVGSDRATIAVIEVGPLATAAGPGPPFPPRP